MADESQVDFESETDSFEMDEKENWMFVKIWLIFCNSSFFIRHFSYLINYYF